MILLLLLSLAEPPALAEPPKRALPAIEVSPPDYSGVCDVGEMSGALKFSVSGKGKDRILRFESVDRGLMPDEARVEETVSFGNAWVQERLTLGDGQSRLFGSFQWNIGETVGRLTVWEPMVGYSPMKVVVAGKCDLVFGDKL